MKKIIHQPGIELVTLEIYHTIQAHTYAHNVSRHDIHRIISKTNMPIKISITYDYKL